MTLPLAYVAPPEPRRGFGITALVLGGALLIGVALWLLTGSALFLALVWVLPLVIVAAIILGSIHLIVAVLAMVFGILAIARNRGRVMGIIGIVLTVVATATAALVGVFFSETLGALSLV